MYDYLETLNHEDRKNAEGAIVLAESCGVNPRYARAYMSRGNCDCEGMEDHHIYSFAGTIMREYNDTYSSPERPNLINWKKYRAARDWKKQHV